MYSLTLSDGIKVDETKYSATAFNIRSILDVKNVRMFLIKNKNKSNFHCKLKNNTVNYYISDNQAYYSKITEKIMYVNM